MQQRVWPSLGVEVLHESYDDAAQGHHRQLVAGAHHAGEEDGVTGGAEHVTVHLFPPVLITEVPLLRRSKSS